MPLEYEDYGEITYVACKTGALYNLQKDFVCKLQLAKYTNNYYRIIGAHGGAENLDFKVQDGIAIISSPEATMCKFVGYDMHCVTTSGVYLTYGNINIWYNTYYEDSTVSGTEGNKLVEGSVYISYTLHAVNAGLLISAWQQDMWQVTKVY